MNRSHAPLFVAATAALLASGCWRAARAPRSQSPTDVVATVGSESITLAQVDARALRRAATEFGELRLSQAVYQARLSALDEIVGDHLLDNEARSRTIDRDRLVDTEITSKVAAPTEADVAAWYGSHPDRVQGASLDRVQAPIRALLFDERTRAARESFLDTLRAKTPVRIALEPPREQVEADGRPSRGPANAAVEIIEFSDFQCPYCLRAHPVVEQVLRTYGDRVRFVYRHFPLESHPNARPAAEAAACAADQNKFWAYHDRLFDHQDKLSGDDLKAHAAALGLDVSRFDDCVSSRKFRKDVEADIAAGASAGVTGTPAFFVNGRVLEGAQPYEVFSRVVDEELKLAAH
jgi:protein-disulfide isomerase